MLIDPWAPNGRLLTLIRIYIREHGCTGEYTSFKYIWRCRKGSGALGGPLSLTPLFHSLVQHPLARSETEWRHIALTSTIVLPVALHWSATRRLGLSALDSTSTAGDESRALRPVYGLDPYRFLVRDCAKRRYVSTGIHLLSQPSPERS